MSTEERSVNQPEEQPSLSEQRLIRRAKLKELQDAGQDPFQITKFVVKHHSADIKEGFEALEGAMTSVVTASCPSVAWARPCSAICRTARAASSSTSAWTSWARRPSPSSKDRHRRHRGRGRRGL
ncbi:hypothetical protein M5E87_15820 [Flavonifractor plautii]|nr:hypothetical protein M5E87_15820 [Flavonifractor plautii]